MTVSLTDFMSNKTGLMELEIPFEADALSIGGDLKKVRDKSPVRLELTVAGHDRLGVKASFSAVVEAVCDRCLKDVDVPVKVLIDREIDLGSEEEKDDALFLDGYDLDVDQMISEEILIGFPMKVLCREDCRGICKVCGADLNDGECACDRTELDPRMSVIRDVFNKFNDMNKEV